MDFPGKRKYSKLGLGDRAVSQENAGTLTQGQRREYPLANALWNLTQQGGALSNIAYQIGSSARERGHKN